MRHASDAASITTPEERNEWIEKLNAAAEKGRAKEKRLRSNPPGEGNYGQRVNWGHELDQAISAYELAEKAIRYLSGEDIDLEDLEMLQAYTDLDYYEILVERVDDR